jgi:nucleoside-diphosphate-sugar epimerase
MDVLLTGGTGLVGAAVLRSLLTEGHTVTALVRSEASASAVAAAGANALLGDITDVDWLSEQLRSVDGAIHAASPGDATSADFDAGVARAAVAAFTGTGRPYVHSSGIWIYGNGDAITERSPFDAPPLTAWRMSVEQIVLDATGMRGIVVAPGIVFGNGAGLPNLISQAPRTEDGALTLIGDGTQHWTTVHARDLADLYVKALEGAAHGSRYIGASGANPTVRELGEAAARAKGGDGRVVAESVQESRARLGELLADALVLSQQATAAKARMDLGWEPNGPSLLSELQSGSYAG